MRNETGGAIDPDGLKRIEALIPDSVDDVKHIKFSEGTRDGKILMFDASEAYIENIKKLVDLQKIKDAGFTVVVDAMWGNGAGWFPTLMAGGSTQINEVHNERNPIFPFMTRPEPIPPNVDHGLSFVKKLGADVAIINDGDADRVGFGQAKIYQKDVAIGRDLDVTRLDVTVQDRWLACVQVRQRIAHGCTHQNGIVFADIAYTLHALA